MRATFQYVDHVGCACSTSSCGACAWLSAESGRLVMLACVSIGSPLLDEVDESEDHDPDDVDEVPIQRRDVDEQGVARREPAAIVDREERHQPQHSGGDVRAVESGEREERRAEKIAADGETFMDEGSELERLEPEERRARDRGHPQPQLGVAEDSLATGALGQLLVL